MSVLSRRSLAVAGIVAALGLGVVAPVAAVSGATVRAHATSIRRAAPAAAARSGFRVVSVTPAPAASSVNGAADVVIRFSGLLAASSPRPAITPGVAGTWSVVGDAFVFSPAGAFPPGTRVHLRVPAGRAGVTDRAGHLLASPFRAAWSIAPLSTLRAEQILAELGYLPVRFVPSHPAGLGLPALAKAAFDPPAGAFRWTFDAPGSLRRLWLPGRPSVVLDGALMAFQAKVGLPGSGALDAATEAALLAAGRDPARFVDRLGYSYAVVQEGAPETFTLYHDGRVAVQSDANTGISIEPTTIGTFPVYLRYETQVMRGTNPDGQPYADPVAWVAYFYGGEAVHYIARASYGWPQSLGCVELPWTAAAAAWPLLGIGTLVTVES